MIKVIFCPDWEMQVTGLLAHYKKNIFLLFLLCSINLSAQVFPDEGVDNLLKQGIEKLIEQDFSSARNSFVTLDRKYPAIPLGKIYRAAVIIAECYDKAEPFNNLVIDSLLTSAIEQSDNLINRDDNNPWNKYYLALAEGYKAYFEALNENWLPALSRGMNSISGFNKCLKQDSLFFEAYAALGTYKYWKSRKTEFLNWLPFIEDEKQEGIQYLIASVKKSTYNYYLGIYSLQWIYIDKKEFKKSASISEQVLSKYPESRFFKWGYARALEDINLIKAIKIYDEILNSYTGNSNHFNEILLNHIIAQCYSRLGEKEEAIKRCDKILSVKNLSPYVIEKLDGRLERVKTLRKQLSAK